MNIKKIPKIIRLLPVSFLLGSILMFTQDKPKVNAVDNVAISGIQSSFYATLLQIENAHFDGIISIDTSLGPKKVLVLKGQVAYAHELIVKWTHDGSYQTTLSSNDGTTATFNNFTIYLGAIRANFNISGVNIGTWTVDLRSEPLFGLAQALEIPSFNVPSKIFSMLTLTNARLDNYFFSASPMSTPGITIVPS